MPPAVAKVVPKPPQGLSMPNSKALPKPPAIVKKIATAPAALNVKLTDKAMAVSSRTQHPALAKLANNVTFASSMLDRAVVNDRKPTRDENLRAARGVATVAAAVGAAYVGVGGLVKGAATAGKAASAGMKAKKAADALQAKKQKGGLSAAESAELERLNAEIAAEERAAKSAPITPEQKQAAGVVGIAAAGLLALKLLAFV